MKDGIWRLVGMTKTDRFWKVSGMRKLTQQVLVAVFAMVIGLTGFVTDAEAVVLFSENFGVGTGSLANWSDAGSDRTGIWQANSGNTPSTTGGDPGPKDDQAGGEFYAYIEASSPVASGEVFILTANPSFDGSTQDLSVSFYWNMNFGGNDPLGELHLDVSNNNGGAWTNSVWSRIGENNPVSTAWSGPQVVDLSAYTGTQVKIRFRAIPQGGTTWWNDIAIDTVDVIGTPNCSLTRLQP